MASAAVLPNASVLLTSPRQARSVNLPKRRRPTAQQGRALEALGHAIEYLIDSRLPEGGTNSAENQAVRLMMASSRAVFEECPAVVTLTEKVGLWLHRRVGRAGNGAGSMKAQLR